MPYKELFEEVADFVRAKGIEVDFDCGKPLRGATVKRLRKECPVPIPMSLIDLYAELGDGFEFYWLKQGKESVCANLEFEPLEDLVDSIVDGMSYGVEWDDDYEFKGTKDPDLARQTAQRMRSWFHFHREGNGDTFCLEPEGTGASVVFNRMAWMDGGKGDNGEFMAASLEEFLGRWSRVCFQFPSSYHWPKIVLPDRLGVDWDTGEFRDDFRLP